MRYWIVLILCFAHPFAARAEPFQRAEVTKAINVVSHLPRNTKAVPGDVVSGDSALKTGGNSRAELEFPDLTITRIGSNALFRFVAGKRDIILDSGTLLFSSPQGAGGGKVQVGAITAAVTGTDFLVSKTSLQGVAKLGLDKQWVAMNALDKQAVAKQASDLAALTQELNKVEAAKLVAAKQDTKLGAKLAAVAQQIAQQDPVKQQAAKQDALAQDAAQMAAMQEAAKKQQDKLALTSNMLAKQAASLAKITQNFAQQGAVTQPAVTQEAVKQDAVQQAVVQEAGKVDATLDLFAQATEKQKALNQNIAELAEKLRLNQEQLAGTQDSAKQEALKQEQLKLMTAMQEALNKQSQSHEMTSNLVSKMDATLAQVTQNLTAQPAVTQTASTQQATQKAAELSEVKVICLTGKVLVYFTANPKLRLVLKPGQMVNISPGATKMPPIVTINLGALISTSVLINMGPLRSQAALERNATNQQASLLARFFPGVNDLLTQTGSQPAQVMTTQAGQTARLAGSGPPPPPPPPAPAPAG